MWGLWEVTGVRRGHESGALIKGFSALRRRDNRKFALSPPCEDTVRRKPSASQEESSQQKQNSAGP